MTTKKLDSGVYEVRGDTEDPRTGKRRQIKRHFKTLREAREFERELLLGNAVSRKSMPTFDEYAREWLDIRVQRKKIAAATYDIYKWAIGTVSETLGSRRIESLTTRQIEAALAGIEGKHSASSVSLVLSVIHFVCKAAMRDGLIKNDPCLYVEGTRGGKKAVPTPDAEKLAEILQASENDMYVHAFLLTLAATGCRKGELYGLMWDAVDLDKCVIHIERQRVQTSLDAREKYAGDIGADVPGLSKNYVLKNETKTRQRRSIKIPANVADVLRQLRMQQKMNRMSIGADYIVSDYVFTRADGRPLLDADTKPYLKGYTLHSIRHAHATILLDEGVPLISVSRRLGHANTGTTSEVYAELLKKQDDAASDVFAAALDTKMTHGTHTNKAK